MGGREVCVTLYGMPVSFDMHALDLAQVKSLAGAQGGISAQ